MNNNYFYNDYLQLDMTALHYAVKNNHVDCVRLIMNYGPDINQTNKVIFYNHVT